MSCQQIVSTELCFSITNRDLKCAVKSASYSKTYVKKIVKASFLNILYHRMIVEENQFQRKLYEGIPYVTFKPKATDKYIRRFHDWMYGFSDALNKGYIKDVHLFMLDTINSTPVEKYKFILKYTDEHKQTPVESAALSKTTKNFLETLSMLGDYQKLPKETKLHVEFSYYDNTPQDYEPPGFEPSLERLALKTAHVPRGESLILGLLETGYHSIQCFARGDVFCNTGSVTPASSVIAKKIAEIQEAVSETPLEPSPSQKEDPETAPKASQKSAPEPTRKASKKAAHKARKATSETALKTSQKVASKTATRTSKKVASEAATKTSQKLAPKTAIKTSQKVASEATRKAVPVTSRNVAPSAFSEPETPEAEASEPEAEASEPEAEASEPEAEASEPEAPEAEVSDPREESVTMTDNDTNKAVVNGNEEESEYFPAECTPTHRVNDCTVISDNSIDVHQEVEMANITIGSVISNENEAVPDAEAKCLCQIEVSLPDVDLIKCEMCQKLYHAPCHGYYDKLCIVGQKFVCVLCDKPNAEDKFLSQMHVDEYASFASTRLFLMMIHRNGKFPTDIMKLIPKKRAALILHKLKSNGVVVKSATEGESQTLNAESPIYDIPLKKRRTVP